MIVNTIIEAKVNFYSLIEKVMTGEEVIIKKAGKPVAVLSEYTEIKKKRRPGVLEGKIHIADDFDELSVDLTKF